MHLSKKVSRYSHVDTLSFFSLSLPLLSLPALFESFQFRERRTCMRITLDNLATQGCLVRLLLCRRRRRCRCCRRTPFSPLFLSLLLSSRHARGETGFREIFFSRPRFLGWRFNGIKKFPRCTSLRPLLPRGARDSA